jgi:hypothetical protein
MNRREIAIHTLKMALFIGVAFAFAFGLISILSMGFHKPIRETLRWIPSYWTNHIGLFLVGFVGIWVCSNHQPRNWGFSINHPKINLSILLGILLAVVGFLQSFLLSKVISISSIPFKPTPMNLFWMGLYIWIFVGIAEETLYRGMVQTYLMKHLNGQIRIIKWDFKLGTLIAAVLFGCSHLCALSLQPYPLVISNVISTTIGGLILGYLYQQTNSLIGPIIAHNLSNGLANLLIGLFLAGV